MRGKKSVRTPGVLLTLVPGKTTTPMWRMGDYSQVNVSLFKSDDIGIGMGFEEGSQHYISVLTTQGEIYSVLETDLRIV